MRYINNIQKIIMQIDLGFDMKFLEKFSDNFG